MKKIILAWLALASSLPAFHLYAQKGRPQWTEKEAWEWHHKVGIIKGFNEPVPAYPGMSRREILKQANELGFNSVRFWVKGETADEQEAFIREMADDAGVFGLTISPALVIDRYYFRGNNSRNFTEAEKCTKQIISAFAGDRRIIAWDIWNEPVPHESQALYEQMDWIVKIIDAV